MTRLAVNVGFLYRELPWADRFAAARADGFDAVESAWPADPDAFADLVGRAGLGVALLNVDAGDLDAGERGWTNDPAAVPRWRSAFEAALRLAGRVDCPTLNVLAGNRLADVPLEAQRSCLEANLRWALERARDEGRALVVEMLNRFDIPDYLVTDLAAAEALIAPLRAAGLRLQFDTYHVARAGLDVAATFRQLGSWVGHVQVGDVPGRHEPGTGAIDWPAFWAALREAGYDGAVGLEYEPLSSTRSSFDWLAGRSSRPR